MEWSPDLKVKVHMLMLKHQYEGQASNLTHIYELAGTLFEDKD